MEEREKYKAVFNDQYQEYKDLHRDISTTLRKFRELDTMMARLLRDGKSQGVRWICNEVYLTIIHYYYTYLDIMPSKGFL